MATLAQTAVTLSDLAKRMDPDGKIAVIVEMLNQTNEMLSDMLWLEGNLPTGHRTSVRTGLPQAAWRLLNGGVQPSKSTTAQIDEACGMLEAYSQVDVDLAKLNGNLGQFRLSEARPFIEAMNIEMASTVIYGNSSIAAEEFTGLAPRYSSLSAANAQNIVNAGGSGSDNASIWLICWGDQTVHGIYPKGSQAGLFHEDLGQETVENAGGVTGALMQAFRDHWQWKCGIALKDWRYAVRGANIDVSNLVDESSAADLTKVMTKMTHRIIQPGMGKCAFYMNRTVFQALDIQRREDVKDGGSLGYDVVDGKRIPMFRGFPIRLCDALLDTEAAVV
jgi:hypothetical protein